MIDVTTNALFPVSKTIRSNVHNMLDVKAFAFDMNIFAQLNVFWRWKIQGNVSAGLYEIMHNRNDSIGTTFIHVASWVTDNSLVMRTTLLF